MKYVSHMCLAGTMVTSWPTRGGWVAGSSPFTVMTNNFFTRFTEFSEIFREKSNENAIPIDHNEIYNILVNQ